MNNACLFMRDKFILHSSDYSEGKQGKRHPRQIRHSEQSGVQLTDSLRKEFEIPTIFSLLDLDFYKLTMGQFVWDHKELCDVPVKYEFKNRTDKVRLADYIPKDVLERQLKRIQGLRMTDEDILHLKSIRGDKESLFSDEYLKSLKDLRLPYVNLSQENGQYHISVEGSWSKAIYWETLILSTVNELYYRALRHETGRSEEDVRTEGRARLQRKIGRLQALIERENAQGRKGPVLIDFGTRRRYGGDWQEEVIRETVKAFPNNFLGTSNVHLSRRLGIPARGTKAHELDMGFSGKYHDEDDMAGTFESHNRLMDMWYRYREYGKALSIALTDTYGSDFFFANFTKEQAIKWNGIRQDSGDPFEIGEKAIKFYQDNGIDPTAKILIFSDGLYDDLIIELYKRFKVRINPIFAWGTTLTNDVGFGTLSLVVKATEANGHKTVKLSDTRGKETGDRESIERAKRFSGHTGGIDKELVV